MKNIYFTEVQVKSILLLQEKGVAIILLEGPGEKWNLPILAKPSEVFSISLALEGQEPPRPQAHDLIVSIIQRLNAKVLHVLIDILDEPLCHGIIALDIGGRELDFDSRPSDAISLALRVHAPIFVSPDVVAKGAVHLNHEEGSLDLGERTKLRN
jgi:uncharacterized protein